MTKTALCASILAIHAVTTPARADELADLRAAIAAAKATATGSRSTIYGSVFHHFDKITEVYFAADYLKLKDGYKVGVTNGAPNQTEFGMGLRTRF